MILGAGYVRLGTPLLIANVCLDLKFPVEHGPDYGLIRACVELLVAPYSGAPCWVVCGLRAWWVKHRLCKHMTMFKQGVYKLNV
jgi:hypothetical protein